MTRAFLVLMAALLAGATRAAPTWPQPAETGAQGGRLIWRMDASGIVLHNEFELLQRERSLQIDVGWDRPALEFPVPVVAVGLEAWRVRADGRVSILPPVLPFDHRYHVCPDRVQVSADGSTVVRLRIVEPTRKLVVRCGDYPSYDVHILSTDGTARGCLEARPSPTVQLAPDGRSFLLYEPPRGYRGPPPGPQRTIHLYDLNANLIRTLQFIKPGTAFRGDGSILVVSGAASGEEDGLLSLQLLDREGNQAWSRPLPAADPEVWIHDLDAGPHGTSAVTFQDRAGDVRCVVFDQGGELMLDATLSPPKTRRGGPNEVHTTFDGAGRLLTAYCATVRGAEPPAAKDAALIIHSFDPSASDPAPVWSWTIEAAAIPGNGSLSIEDLRSGRETDRALLITMRHPSDDREKLRAALLIAPPGVIVGSRTSPAIPYQQFFLSSRGELLLVTSGEEALLLHFPGETASGP